MFPLPVFNATIFEDALPTFSVTQVTATDDDDGEFGMVYYSISDIQPEGTDGTFSIDESTGVVRTNGTFDREVFAGPYVITVNKKVLSYSILLILCFDAQIAARDGGIPPNNNSATLEVYILDINDNSPVFGIGMLVYNCTVK